MKTLPFVRSSRNQTFENVMNLSDCMTDVAESAQVMQDYTTSVLRQQEVDFSDIPTSELPPLTDYYRTARANATFYNTNLRPLMLGNVSAIQGYARNYAIFQANILQALRAYEEGSPAGKSDARALIMRLITDVDDLRESSSQIGFELGGYGSLLEIDVGNFAGANTTITTLLDGDQGLVSDLMSQIKAIDDQITLNSHLAVGAGLLAAGAALFVIIGTIATVGTGAPVLITGAITAVAGVSGAAIFGAAAAKLSQDKRNLIVALNQTLKRQASLAVAASDTNSLNHVTSRAAKNVQAMANAWSLISADLQGVIRKLDDGQSAENLFLIRTDLEAALEGWNCVQKRAVEIRETLGNVSTRTLPQLDSASIMNLQAELDREFPVPAGNLALVA